MDIFNTHLFNRGHTRRTRPRICQSTITQFSINIKMNFGKINIQILNLTNYSTLCVAFIGQILVAVFLIAPLIVFGLVSMRAIGIKAFSKNGSLIRNNCSNSGSTATTIVRFQTTFARKFKQMRIIH